MLQQMNLKRVQTYGYKRFANLKSQELLRHIGMNDGAVMLL